MPASAFTWQVDFHHETHIHPFIPDTPGSTGGSFMVPTTGHTAADVWYRIHLTVRDSGGLTHTTYRDVLPRTATITLATAPAGRQLDARRPAGHGAPHFTGVVGIVRDARRPSPQSRRQDLGVPVVVGRRARRPTAIATPCERTTYTATYRDTTPPPSAAPAASAARQGLVGVTGRSTRAAGRRRRTGPATGSTAR